MEQLHAIIVDDAPGARKLLRLMLQELAPDVAILGEAGSVPEAAGLIKAQRPDVVFLDIEMPGQSGLHLVEEVSRSEVPYEIIFTTAYNEYALRAFRLSAADYLLKPIGESELQEAVAKLRIKQQQNNNEERLRQLLKHLRKEEDAMLSIPCSTGYEFIKADDVIYIRAEGSYTEIVMERHRAITVSKNLKYFETLMISFGQFVRVHRSYLVNLQHMRRFEKADRGLIVMSDGMEISLARERREAFFSAMEKMKRPE